VRSLPPHPGAARAVAGLRCRVQRRRGGGSLEWSQSCELHAGHTLGLGDSSETDWIQMKRHCRHLNVRRSLFTIVSVYHVPDMQTASRAVTLERFAVKGACEFVDLDFALPTGCSSAFWRQEQPILPPCSLLRSCCCRRFESDPDCWLRRRLPEQ
jgi:hypothetical protein